MNQSVNETSERKYPPRLLADAFGVKTKDGSAFSTWVADAPVEYLSVQEAFELRTEMLAVLKVVAEELDTVSRTDEYGVIKGSVQVDIPVLKIVRAMIAKAEGRSA